MRELLADAVGGTAEHVLDHLKQRVDGLCDGQAPNDDVTFLVLKARPIGGAFGLTTRARGRT